MISNLRVRASVWIVSLTLFGAVGTGAQTAPTLSAEEVLRKGEAAFGQLQDYECLATTQSQKGKRTQGCTERIWFKKPGQLRIKVIKGDHRGSEIAIDANRKVRGHAGGILRPIVIGVKFNDSRLKTLRGVHISELDWGTLIRKFREHAALPGARTELSARKEGEPYEVWVTYTLDGHAMRDVLRFDPTQWSLVGTEIYEDGVRVDQMLFTAIKLNPGLDDRFFRL